ncbi:TPA: FAD-dependent oxidoreductase [Providencia alcalifaciens]|uniref:FAD-dependent oxidoreductase n=1 Tax=Providencia alcalifaciens TaxID=126385 RepID=UPI0004499C97|nr:FAD-dependent oxidoreductase [Providencia alcalifaciens]EUD05506.1 pyridine nucleotide-disulfide oxidoreductase [Providencia alcalifaciens R90-1475]
MSSSNRGSPRREPNKKALTIRKIEFVEIYQPMSGLEAQHQAQRCLSCGSPYCEWKCPLHNPIPNWLKLAGEGRILEAAELCHHTNSLPEICGRICPQERLCEAACVLDETFGSVTIGHLERYITDSAFEQGWRPDLSHVRSTGKRVAIIGAGPAGLSCADILARHGVQATVFDKFPEIGGLLTFGIPAFKLEKQIMQRRRHIFEEMGITFKLNTEVGKDIPLETLANEFDAIFVGTGTHKPVSGCLPNESAIGAYQALPYLMGNTHHLLGYPDDPQFPYISLAHKNVVVLGAGDTAMDCVRSAIRQGANQVHCIYRGSMNEMSATTREVIHAQEEGAQFHFHLQPVSINTNSENHVISISFVNTEKNAIATKKVLYPADVVIMAFGFESEALPWLKEHAVQYDKDGRIIAPRHHRYAYQTSNPKIFAGGDVVHGSDLVVTAIAEGRGAAEGILTFLQI